MREQDCLLAPHFGAARVLEQEQPCTAQLLHIPDDLLPKALANKQLLGMGRPNACCQCSACTPCFLSRSYGFRVYTKYIDFSLGV